MLWGYFTLILLIFILIKTPDLALAASRWLHGLMGQNAGRAAAVDIRWLGYSYIAFRLIHTVRDRQSGRLPVVVTAQWSVAFELTLLTFWPPGPGLREKVKRNSRSGI